MCVLITPSKEFVPSLMLTNVMSLAPKIDEVRLFVTNSNPDLVFITETWLKNAIDTNHIHIPEYITSYVKTVLVDPTAVFVYTLRIQSNSKS